MCVSYIICMCLSLRVRGVGLHKQSEAVRTSRRAERERELVSVSAARGLWGWGGRTESRPRKLPGLPRRADRGAPVICLCMRTRRARQCVPTWVRTFDHIHDHHGDRSQRRDIAHVCHGGSMGRHGRAVHAPERAVVCRCLDGENATVSDHAAAQNALRQPVVAACVTHRSTMLEHQRLLRLSRCTRCGC